MIGMALPPQPADLVEAREDAINALSTLSIEAEIAYRAAGYSSRAELLAFIDRAKQLLSVVVTAAAVLP